MAYKQPRYTSLRVPRLPDVDEQLTKGINVELSKQDTINKDIYRELGAANTIEATGFGYVVHTAGGAYVARTFQAIANQTTVTNGSGVGGNTTYGTVQDINTTSSPTFAGLTDTGLTASTMVRSDGGKKLASSGAIPSDATQFLNGAVIPAFAAVKDSDLSTSDITTNNVSSTKHGFAPKSTSDATKFLRDDATPVWATAVTSVGLSGPTEMSITGTPVTTSGTLAIAWSNENANIVFAGPSSGAAAIPTFRALVVADIPTGIPGTGSALLTVGTDIDTALAATNNVWTVLPGNPAVLLQGGTLPSLSSANHRMSVQSRRAAGTGTYGFRLKDMTNTAILATISGLTNVADAFNATTAFSNFPAGDARIRVEYITSDNATTAFVKVASWAWYR